MKIASLATISERKIFISKVVKSLHPYVDELYINNGEKPLGDANKFRGVIGKEGYCFTMDDDLEYPPDYVNYMISKIEQYSRSAVITLHGKVIVNQPIESFYGGDFIKYRCLDDVKEDVPVHIPGTGVMAWHSDTIGFSMNDFKAKNMADIWAGIKCEKEGVQRICVAHEKGWLTNLEPEEGCYEWNRKRDDVLTEAINSIEWSEL